MSIVIHGMDMPTDKPIALIINPDGQVSKVGNYEKTWEAAAVDAVEVVRCRECSRRYAKDFGQYCPARVGPVRPDGYCDGGQRREDGDYGAT